VYRIDNDHISVLTRKIKETTVAISELSGAQKGIASKLYFVDCRTQLIRAVGDTTQPAALGRFATREVTQIFLSFTSCDIFIALPGGGVTMEAGKMEREVGGERSCSHGCAAAER
jgi:hypothetical protein